MKPAIFADDATELAAKLVEVTDMLDKLVVLNPEAMLLEPRDSYDLALIGITCTPNDHWPREENVWRASRSSCDG